MPRPVSWLPRLHEIRRSVERSVRSHYGRQDLQDLFALQPRSAQKLFEVLPSLLVGTSRLVERSALAEFLDRVNEAEDVSGFIEALRLQRIAPVRRRLRSLVQTDHSPAATSVPPEGLSLARGKLEMRFETVEQLAEAMYYLARLLERDGDGFAASFEPRNMRSPEAEPALHALFEELKELEFAPN